MKQSTLCFLRKDGMVLLAMKKRSFGEGLWNGPGGKIDPGETPEAAAVRELKEEILVDATESDLQPAGFLHFRSETEKFNWNVNVFALRQWTGDPQESEEMRPQWFAENEIPFDTMWPDDRHWLPYVLSGKKFEATFNFDSEGKMFTSFEINEIT